MHIKLWLKTLKEAFNLGLGTPKCRWKENFKLYLKAVGRENVNWIHLAHDRIQ
jgi:hypothetical protein